MKEFQFKRAKAERWLEIDPVLKLTEPGFEIVDGSPFFKLKFGDGVSHWSELPYFSGGQIVPFNAGTFRGTCDTHTDPGTPTSEEWWSATEPGVYSNFGDVEVPTIYNVFNYIKWNNDTGQWSLEVVEIKSNNIQIPRITDDILDFYVTGDFQIGAKPYGAKKATDLGYAYLYTGMANPTYHNRLNLDGDLYMSKLFAWDINMPGGTAMKWLSLDASKNIVFNDPPSGGGVTPVDQFLDWDSASSMYKPYVSKKGSDPGYPYAYSADTVPTFINLLNFDAYVRATQFMTGYSSSGSNYALMSGTEVGLYGSSPSASRFNPSTWYQQNGANRLNISGSDTIFVSLSGSNVGNKSLYLGNPSTASGQNGAHLRVYGDANRFEVNMANTRFGYGTPLKWLTLNANKDIAYVDNYETRAFHFRNVLAGDYLYLEPKAGYSYSIQSIYVDCLGIGTNAYFYLNSTQYSIQNVSVGIEILSGGGVIPTNMAVGDTLKLQITNNVPELLVRIKMLRTI